jgi:hypothetical protein
MKKRFLIFLVVFPSIAFSGQGIFLKVNNFTKDEAFLTFDEQLSWKVVDLGGGDRVPACSTQKLYTEVNGLSTANAYFKGSITAGHGEDSMVGEYGLWYGSHKNRSGMFPDYQNFVDVFSVNEYFKDERLSGYPRWTDSILIGKSISRGDSGSWNNGVVGNYLFNDGRKQDLVSLTILPKRGESDCSVNSNTFEFMMADRFARAIKNHPKDFRIIQGPHKIVKNAIERGLVNEGYTFISDLPQLPIFQEPSFSANNEKTNIEKIGDGDYDETGTKIPDSMKNTWTTGKYCNTTQDPQRYVSPSYSMKFSEKSTTTLKNAWGVDVGFKGTITADAGIKKATFEKSVLFKYSGEVSTATELLNELTVTLPSQNIDVAPGKCKRLTYSLSHTKITTELNVDYQVNPNADFLISLYSGISSPPYVYHRQYKVTGKLVDLLKSPDDGYISPQFVVINNADKSKRPDIFLRGRAELNAEYGWGAIATIVDVLP